MKALALSCFLSLGLGAAWAQTAKPATTLFAPAMNWAAIELPVPAAQKKELNKVLLIGDLIFNRLVGGGADRGPYIKAINELNASGAQDIKGVNLSGDTDPELVYNSDSKIATGKFLTLYTKQGYMYNEVFADEGEVVGMTITNNSLSQMWLLHQPEAGDSLFALKQYKSLLGKPLQPILATLFVFMGQPPVSGLAQPKSFASARPYTLHNTIAEAAKPKGAAFASFAAFTQGEILAETTVAGLKYYYIATEVGTQPIAVTGVSKETVREAAPLGSGEVGLQRLRYCGWVRANTVE